MNAGASLVSVIVPTRNSARTLESCLISIRSQAYKPIELIVVDNASTDQTVEIAKLHADLVEAFGPERSAQRNRGARLAHGAHLLFIDSDMRVASNVVGECMDVVRTRHARGVVIPELSVGEGFLARCRAFERSCYVGDDMVEAARFFPRPVFEAVGGFDESLDAFEDWDLSMRIGVGSSLPRVRSYITHDEGELRLRAVMAKKRLYGASFLRYWRKHSRSALGKANPLFRPAFLRNWPKFVGHPVLATGVIVLKSLEAAAATWGLVEGQLGARRERGSRPRSS